MDGFNNITFGDLKVGDQFYRIDRRRCAMHNGINNHISLARCMVKSINIIGLVCYIRYHMNGATPNHIERMQCLPDSRCLKFDDAYLVSNKNMAYMVLDELIEDNKNI